MDVKDAVDELELYHKHQQVSDSEASHVMSALIEMSYYPDFFVIPGGNEMAIINQHFGKVVAYNIFNFLGEVFAGRKAITEFNFDNRFPQHVQQSKDVTSVLFSLYFRVWSELRNNNMTSFPYTLANIGNQGGLYTRADKHRILEQAGI